MEEYRNCIEGIFEQTKLSDIDNVRKLLEILGNPQDSLKFIHVAGTNGKGSVCSYLSNILIEAGYKTGMFTSPGIESVNDRFRIDNIRIDDDELKELALEVKAYADRIGGNFCEFEMMTCIGFLFFSRHSCDIVVLETGIGGKSDVTNIIKDKELSVITSIGFDHMELLGNTLEEIAKEKAGIIAENSFVVCGDIPEEAFNVIEKKALEKSSKLHRVNTNDINNVGLSNREMTFDYKAYKNIKTKLIGIHQTINAATAIETCEILKKKGYSIDLKNIFQGIYSAVWEGRMEIISENPLIILDGAHNIEGAEMLKKNIDCFFSERRRIFVMGMLKQKDYENVVKTLISGAKYAIAVPVDSSKMCSGEEMLSIMKECCQNSAYNDTIYSGLAQAVEISDINDIICVCGSLYLVNSTRQYFKAGEKID